MRGERITLHDLTVFLHDLSVVLVAFRGVYLKSEVKLWISAASLSICVAG
jgi:hypothetical protein